MSFSLSDHVQVWSGGNCLRLALSVCSTKENYWIWFSGGCSLSVIQMHFQLGSEQTKNITGYINHKLLLLLILVFGLFVIALPLLFMYVLSFLVGCGFLFVIGLLCFAEELCRAPISWAFCYSHCILVLYQSWWPCSIGGRDEWKTLAVFQVTLCFPWDHINLVLGFFHLCNTECVFFFYTVACCCCFFSESAVDVPQLWIYSLILSCESVDHTPCLKKWIYKTHYFTLCIDI